MSWCLIVSSLPHCPSFDGEEFEGRKTIVYSNARAWSRLAFVLSCFNHVLFFCNSITCSPPISSVHGDSPGKNTGVGCHALLQGTFLTQGSSPRLLCLLHLQTGSLPLVPPGKSQSMVHFPLNRLKTPDILGLTSLTAVSQPWPVRPGLLGVMEKSLSW